MILLYLFLVFVAFWQNADAGLVSLCKDIKNCTACANSFIYILGFEDYCRWCVDTNSCGGPFGCPSGSGIVRREPFMCPQPASNVRGHRYTDRLGRSLFSLALAVKNSDPTECLKNSRPDIKLIKRYEVDCDQSHNKCAAMLAVSTAAKSIYVVYKSSNMDKQLVTEFVHSIAAQLGAWQKFVNGSGVIIYFHDAFQRLFIKAGLEKDLMKLKEQYPEYKVWITGHSLGGSLAAMTALYLVQKQMFTADRVRLVTFGEPRTGNVAFARAIEENVKFRYRVVHRNDLMTNAPAAFDANNIIFTKLIAERQPHFYRYLIFYDNDMKHGDLFKVCKTSEDYACRNLALATNALDHTSYFGINADDYLAKKCKSNLLEVTSSVKDGSKDGDDNSIHESEHTV